jgi:hypothetical protein
MDAPPRPTRAPPSFDPLTVQLTEPDELVHLPHHLLFLNDDFSDAVFTFEEHKKEVLPVHRWVVKTRLSVLLDERLVKTSVKKHQTVFCVRKGTLLSPLVVRELLFWAYTGRLRDIALEELLELSECVERQLDSLVVQLEWECVEVLRRHLAVERTGPVMQAMHQTVAAGPLTEKLRRISTSFVFR